MTKSVLEKLWEVQKEAENLVGFFANCFRKLA
jgi:hypothetical protein